jgi:hypothetical protein
VSFRPLRVLAVGAIAVLAAACGGGTESVHSTTTTRPQPSVSLPQVITAGSLTFRLPQSWAVSHGVCRCGWGIPDTATLDNGPEQGGEECGCPEESTDVPSGLHLYEGEAGFDSDGKPTVINDLHAVVLVDASRAIVTATFPSIDQWVTISPGPQSADGPTRQHQVAIERQILATMRVKPHPSE